MSVCDDTDGAQTTPHSPIGFQLGQIPKSASVPNIQSSPAYSAPLLRFPEPQHYKAHPVMPPPPVKGLHDSEENDPQDGWEAVYNRLKDHDSSMVTGYAADMDTVLIFAGLFSAVLTALLTQVYTQLQPDNSQLTVQLLAEIYKQVHNISDGSLAVNTTLTSATAFHASRSIVLINTLWFLSLIFSLAAALFAIFVKQCLREYINWTSVSPVREAVHLRQYRFEAFRTWRVPGIVTALPAVLQVALILFFVGLLILLWTVNDTVARVSTVASGLGLICIIAWVVLPAATETCPYKTPIAWAALRSARWVRIWASGPIQRVAWWCCVYDFHPHSKAAAFISMILAPCTAAWSRLYNKIEELLNGWWYEHEPSWWPSQERLATREKAKRDAEAAQAPVAQPQKRSIYTIGQGPSTLPKHHPMYDHYSWCKRDYAQSLSSLGRDPVRLSAWRCRVLFWTATYEDLDVNTVLSCTGDFFAPSRDLSVSVPPVTATTSNAELATDEFRDDPYRRISAYWLAIQQYLGYGTKNLSLLSSLQKLYEEGQPSRLSSQREFQELQEQLAQLDTKPREIMFHLLWSGINTALDRHHVSGSDPWSAPFDDAGKSLNRLTLASLFMMRLLCHRWSGLHPTYFKLLSRVLVLGSRLRWPKDDKDGVLNSICCVTFMDDATAQLGFADCPLTDIEALANSAMTFFKPEVAGFPVERSCFFALANAALCMQPHEHVRKDDPRFQSYLSAVRFLFQAIKTKLTNILQMNYTPFGWRDVRDHQLWCRLVPFCERYPEVLPSGLDDLLASASNTSHIVALKKDELVRPWVSGRGEGFPPLKAYALPGFVASLQEYPPPPPVAPVVAIPRHSSSSSDLQWITQRDRGSSILSVHSSFVYPPPPAETDV